MFDNNDAMTLVFDTLPKHVEVASKAAVDSLLSFSASLGTDYAGYLDGRRLTIRIINTTGADKPQVGM